MYFNYNNRPIFSFFLIEPTRGRETNHEIALVIIIVVILAGVPLLVLAIVFINRSCTRRSFRANNKNSDSLTPSDLKGTSQNCIIQDSSSTQPLNEGK